MFSQAVFQSWKKCLIDTHTRACISFAYFSNIHLIKIGGWHSCTNHSVFFNSGNIFLSYYSVYMCTWKTLLYLSFFFCIARFFATWFLYLHLSLYRRRDVQFISLCCGRGDFDQDCFPSGRPRGAITCLGYPPAVELTVSLTLLLHLFGKTGVSKQPFPPLAEVFQKQLANE